MGERVTCADSEGRPACVQCRFYRPKGSRCQRYPPAVFFDVNSLERICMFPRVADSMWCGEWAPTYPETTGYIEPTDAKRPATATGDWQDVWAEFPAENSTDSPSAEGASAGKETPDEHND